jgi:hypothetical protein
VAIIGLVLGYVAMSVHHCSVVNDLAVKIVLPYNTSRFLQMNAHWQAFLCL